MTTTITAATASLLFIRQRLPGSILPVGHARVQDAPGLAHSHQLRSCRRHWRDAGQSPGAAHLLAKALAGERPHPVSQMPRASRGARLVRMPLPIVRAVGQARGNVDLCVRERHPGIERASRPGGMGARPGRAGTGRARVDTHHRDWVSSQGIIRPQRRMDPSSSSQAGRGPKSARRVFVWPGAARVRGLALM